MLDGKRCLGKKQNNIMLNKSISRKEIKNETQ